MSGSSSMDRILAQQGDLDLKNVSEKDQAELAQRLAAEMKRLEVQNQTHTLTSMCWKKCIAKSPSSSASSGSTTSSFFGLGGSKSSISPELDSTERQCLANCVERFLDANFATLQHLRTLQKQMGGGGH